MQVIREPNPFQPIELDCTGCEAGLRVELKDIHESATRPQSDQSRYWVSCPRCQTHLAIDESCLNEHHKREIHAKRGPSGYRD